MGREKKKILLLCALGIVFSVGTFFALIESNILYFYFGTFTTASLFICPALCLGIIVVSSVFMFKDNKISYIIPVSLALIGCILAFVFSNDASLNKLESDFLKHEGTFNSSVDEILDEYGVSDGEYEIQASELKWVIPLQKVKSAKIDSAHSALFFIAMDTDNRTEGYAYIPYGAPLEWEENGVWSDAVDMDGYWYYLCLVK